MALSTCSVLFLTTSAYTRNLKVSCNLYGTKHGLPIGLLSRKNVISKIMFLLLKVSWVIHIRRDFAIWLSFNPHKPCKVLTRLYDFVWEFYNLTWEICVPRLRMIEKQFQTYTLSTVFEGVLQEPFAAFGFVCLFVCLFVCFYSWGFVSVIRGPSPQASNGTCLLYTDRGFIIGCLYWEGEGVFVKQSPLPTYPLRQFLTPSYPIS